MSNPYAEIFYKEFKRRFINEKHEQSGWQTPPKMARFIKDFNKFLTKAIPDKELHINADGYKIEPKEFSFFVLGLRAQMIAATKNLTNISEKDTRSPEIIEFFENVKELCIDSSSKLYEDFDYDLFSYNHATRELELCEDIPETSTQNMFFFGVNRSNRQNMEEVNYFFNHASKDIFKQKQFDDVSIYSVCIPKCFPEEISASTIMKTITEPTRFNEPERYFAEENWSHYIGKDLAFDEDGKVTEGSRHTMEELQTNLRNLKIFSYCAGACSAHRCLNALQNIANQLYDKKTVTKLWQNIDVVSFAFPLEAEKTLYHHVSIMCNDKDSSNPETVIKTNFPEQYERLTLNASDTNSIKIHNSKHSKYIALELNKDAPIYDHQGHDISRQINNRNGHRLQNITAQSAYSQNFAVLRYIMDCCLQNKPIDDKKLIHIANAPILCKNKQSER